jgi:hypothetical protein
MRLQSSLPPTRAPLRGRPKRTQVSKVDVRHMVESPEDSYLAHGTLAQIAPSRLLLLWILRPRIVRSDGPTWNLLPAVNTGKSSVVHTLEFNGLGKVVITAFSVSP